MEARNYRYENRYEIIMSKQPASYIPDPDSVPASGWEVIDFFNHYGDAVKALKEYRQAVPTHIVIMEKHYRRVPA